MLWLLVCACRNVLSSQEVVDFIGERIKPDESGHVRSLSSIIEEVSQAHHCLVVNVNLLSLTSSDSFFTVNVAVFTKSEQMLLDQDFQHLSFSAATRPLSECAHVLLTAVGPLSGPGHIWRRDRL